MRIRRQACIPYALVCFLSFVLAPDAAGQPRHVETLEVGLAGIAPVGESYDGLWTAGLGGVLHASTEFHGGQMHFGLHVFSNTPEVQDLPAFRAFRGTLGWGAQLRLPARIRLEAGGSVGALYMIFADGGDDALSNETELTTGLFTRVSAPLTGPLGLFAGVEFVRVYTAAPITYRFVRSGVRVRGPAPVWLRRLFR